MVPKVLEDAKKVKEEALRLEQIGDLEHAIQKFKKALELIRMFCLFTKHPIWFKQCKELQKSLEDKLEQVKSRFEKIE